MINLEASGERETMMLVATILDDTPGTSRVRILDAVRDGEAIVVAAVRPRAVDHLLERLRAAGVPEADVTLSRLEVVGRAARSSGATSLVWEDVLGTAWVNARPIARYLAFMLVAGVIASYGVIDRNGILIVGAMAVSPDLLPITAVGVGLIGRRPKLAVQALLTLIIGLGMATASAATCAFAQDQFGAIPAGFNIDSTVLGTLTTTTNETFVVAFVAGIAGMLALETRASSGVGVAISVTTIPAAAYLGVAIGLREQGEVLGALGVLSVNVAMLVLGSTLTLATQRRLGARAAERRRRARAPS